MTALGVSIIADALDYFCGSTFSSPIIGDIFDSIITSILYSITKSKSATAINLIEFIPFVGDFVPVYTLSTLCWISKELRKPKSESTYYKAPQLYNSKSGIPRSVNKAKTARRKRRENNREINQYKRLIGEIPNEIVDMKRPKMIRGQLLFNVYYLGNPFIAGMLHLMHIFFLI